MSFPRYPKYKASGVEWLGGVPEHWEVCALKRIIRMQSGESITSERIHETGDYPVYGGNGLRGYTSEFTHDGHFVLVGRQGALCGNINFGRGQFWASEHAVVASPVKTVVTVWLGEMMRAMNLNQYSVTAAQPGLSMEQIARLRTAVPSLPEQSVIAEFLDRETGKIDELVAEQRRLMELLKEKRQAVISHAVTKGLNPHAPMKPSGIEWLGKVPEHWAVVPLRWISKCYSGDGLSSEKLKSLDDTVNAIPAVGGNGVMGYTEQGNIEQPVLAIGRVGALCGNIHIVNPPAWITDNALVLDSNPDIFDLEFLCFVMRSRNLNDIASRTAQPLITGTQVRDQRIPSPSLVEQQQITAYLSQKLTQYDNLTAEAQRAIDLLQERRTALISAAVTGQIDVRPQARN